MGLFSAIIEPVRVKLAEYGKDLNLHYQKRGKEVCSKVGVKHWTGFNKSFGDVVKGQRVSLGGKGSVVGSATQQLGIEKRYDEATMNAIDIDDIWLKRCVIAEVDNFETIQGLEDALLKESFLDISVRYLGGNFVLLEFSSEDSKNGYFEGKKEWWNKWFIEYKDWHPLWSSKQRFVWLSVEGCLFMLGTNPILS